MTYEKQVGIVAGGLCRQFFTDLFLAASAGANGIPALLEGWSGQKLIAYNPTLSGAILLKHLEKS